MKISKKHNFLLFTDISIIIISALLVIGGFFRGFGIYGMNFVSEWSFTFFVVLLFLLLFRLFLFMIVGTDSCFPVFLKTRKKTDEYKSVYIGIFLTSVSILMLEILLTRIYSVTLFYHFAFMAISVAIFGGALSGVTVYLFPRFFRVERARTHLSIAVFLFGISAVAGIFLQLQLKITEKYSPLNAKLLILSYLVSAIPFFFGGLAITLGLTHYSVKVSKVYFSDLLGAGCGCLAILAVLNLFDAPSAVFVVASIAFIAAFFFYKDRGKNTSGAIKKSALIFSFAFLSFAILNNDLKIVRVINPKGRKIDYEKVLLEKWNSFSRIAVYDQYHRDWSLSRNYKGDVLQSLYMDIDALASTPIVHFKDKSKEIEYLKWELTFAAFLFNEKPKTFIIGPGGGRDIAAALTAGSEEIDAAEINPIIVNDVMLGKYKAYSGGIYEYPGVNVTINDARSFIRASDEKYDVILASLVDTWAASSAGAYNLSENNLYTVEAFTDFFGHLTDNGVLSIERWNSESIRLLTVAEAMAQRAGIEDISDHIVVVAISNLNNFLLKKSPWRPEEISKLNDWCRERRFWVLWDPIGRSEYQKEGRYLNGSPNVKSSFKESYEADISPVDDNRPFFFQKEKPKGFLEFIKGIVSRKTLFKGNILFNKGISSLQYFILWIAALVLLVIIIPLFLWKRNRIGGSQAINFPPLLFFSLLGLGFIFIEMALMQKFILFLGHPVFSLSVVLFSLLIFCGLGSRFTERWAKADKKKLILKIIPIVALIHLCFILIIDSLFYSLIGLPVILRTIISVILLMIPAFVMGMPMPLGIKYLSQRRNGLIPWAWALNGSFSVLGSALAIYYAIVKGFNFTYVLGIIFYLLAMSAAVLFKKE
jgi:hypothetical protein